MTTRTIHTKFRIIDPDDEKYVIGEYIPYSEDNSLEIAFEEDFPIKPELNQIYEKTIRAKEYGYRIITETRMKICNVKYSFKYGRFKLKEAYQETIISIDKDGYSYDASRVWTDDPLLDRALELMVCASNYPANVKVGDEFETRIYKRNLGNRLDTIEIVTRLTK